MPENKGGRGHRDPDALRRTGVRGPMLRPEIDRLLSAIVQNRGSSKAYHITQALIRYANEEELEIADLVE